MGWTVLITNNTLDYRAGSELYARDIALGLRARGHAPIAYSPILGDVAEDLRRATVPVIDNLDDLGAEPDLIHGHHHLETVTASLRFPRTPVVSFCHGWLPWQEAPALLPTVRRYVAVDATCRDRLVLESGIAPERVRVLHNFVDLRRFRPRAPLPARPLRALVFSNAADETSHLRPIREACAARGIAVDVAGLACGRVLRRPEEMLGAYDLVFAKARAAMEAMASGCAVVLCDRVGAGPLVTAERFLELRELNFGIRALQGPLAADHLGAEIDRYDPESAARVCALMRRHGDLERRLDELLELYASVLAEPRPDDPAALAKAAAAYLRRISPRVKGFEEARHECQARRAEAAELARACAAAERRADELRAENHRLSACVGLRLQAAVDRLPFIGGLARGIARAIFATGRGRS